ncbi:unnamed protein product [Peniophora sp. CBMAI 1063]|nr:unnamed protein product [Peniophora sp. CBMAI 1063]
MPTSSTEAEWTELPRRFWLEMLDARRERDNALAELARLGEDYETVCARDLALGAHRQEAARLRVQVASLRDDARATRDDTRAMEKRMRALESDNVELKKENEELERENEDMRCDLKRAADRIGTDVRYKRYMGLRIRNLEMMLEGNGEAWREMREERDRARVEGDEKEGEVRRLREELTRLGRGWGEDVDMDSDEEVLALVTQSDRGLGWKERKAG